MNSTSPKTLLLVDDDDIFREVLATALEDQGFRIHQAANGSQALECLGKVSDVSLVLSDIQMPKMNGVELLRRIRKLGNLPMILATGFSELAETQTAHGLGASGFLAKPFEMEELLALIRSLLSGEREKTTATDDDFARILIDDFVSGKVLKHNIFIRLSKDKFVKIAHEGVDLDIDRVRDYKTRGVKYLYLKKEDFRSYLGTSLTLARKINSNRSIDREKRDRFIRHTGNLIVEKAMVEEIDSFAVEAARDFFENSLSVIAEDENLFRSLEILNEHSDHVYAHSVSVSLYGIALARAMGWNSAPTTFRVGLTGLFHDIGLKEIDRRILDTPRAGLTRADRILYETHVLRSAEILNSSGSLPEEVVQAILQHHEDPNGFGYPRGLKGMEITPLAKLIGVADAFCEFAVKNPDSPKGMSASEAVEKLEQFRAAALDPAFLKVLKSLVKKPNSAAA